MNIFGRTGAGEFYGYKSLNAWRAAKRIERLKEVAERIEAIERAEKKRDEHYEAWIAARCIVRELVAGVGIECATSRLRADYVAYCGPAATTPQAWGRWMGQRFRRAARNSCGIGRVYLGIALRRGA